MPFFLFLVFLATLVVVMFVGFVILVRELGIAVIYLARHLSDVIGRIFDSVAFGLRSVIYVLRGVTLAGMFTLFGCIYAVRKTAEIIEFGVERCVTGVRTTASAIDLSISGRGKGHFHPTTQQPAQSAMVPKRFGLLSTVHTALACWFAPTCVLATFVALSGTVQREWENRFGPGAFTLSTSVPKSPDRELIANKPVLNQNTLPPLETTQPATPPQSALPQWITDHDTTSSDIQRIVLTSQLWSTEAEADRELSPKVAAIIRADFADRHQGLFNQTGRQVLSEDRIVNVAVKQRYVEHVEKDFGSFDATMNRLYWQVEVSPVVRTELYPEWKAAVTQNRIVVVGALLSLLTLLTTTASTMLSLRGTSAPKRSYPVAVPALSAVAWAAVGFGFVTQLIV